MAPRIDTRNDADRARFQVEFMAMMINTGRAAEAAEAYTAALDYCRRASAELERLQALVPNTAALAAIRESVERA